MNNEHDKYCENIFMFDFESLTNTEIVRITRVQNEYVEHFTRFKKKIFFWLFRLRKNLLKLKNVSNKVLVYCNFPLSQPKTLFIQKEKKANENGIAITMDIGSSDN